MKLHRVMFLALVFGSICQGGENLIPNGDLDVVEGGVPAGWERVIGSADELIYASDGPHRGARFLKLDTRQIDPKLKLHWRLREPIPVEAGANYKLELQFRVDDSNLKGGQAVYARGVYLDAERKALPWRQVGLVSLTTGGWARVTHGWRFRQLEFTPPESAAFIDFTVRPGRGFKGIVGVDSLRIVKLDRSSLALPEGAYAFDFTEVDDKPAPGFTAVPPDLTYSAGKGYGWDIRKPGRRMRTHSGKGYPNSLDSSGVRAATFICDLPNGRYRASIYMGGLWRTQVSDMNHAVSVGQERVVDDVRGFDQLMDEEYFRYSSATLVTPDDLERPGYAVWDRYLARRYRRHDFGLDVRDGRLDLKIRNGHANGIVVFPEEIEAGYEKALDQIDRMRQREFVETWAELLPLAAEQTDYQPTATDRSRGYVVFGRHWMRRLQYAARPQPREVSPTLATFATAGEYEPITFSIWPLRDTKQVRIEVQPLRRDDGSEVPAGAVRVWYHQHRQERRARPCTAYRINTAYLPDWGTRDLYKDITTRCWLSLKLPDDTKPGLYTGAVRVVHENGEPTTVPIRLRVLSFKLVRKDTLHTLRRAGNAVIVPYPSSYPFDPNDSRNKQFYRAQAIRDLYEHGFMPEFSAWWHGIWRIEGDLLAVEWDKDNSLAGRAGEYFQMALELAPRRPKRLWVDACAVGHRHIMPAFEGKPKGGVTKDHIEQWLDELELKAAAAGLERIYVAPWGEESHFPPGKGFERFLDFHRHVRANRKRWPHVFTSHTCNTDWGQPPTIRAADLTALGMFHGVSGSAEEQVEMAQQSGKPFGLYGVRGRWVAGFYFWRTGAYATYHEFYAPYYGTPNNDWDNSLGMDQNARQVMNEAPGWCNATYSPDGRMIGTWFWEEMREGVDDHDYLNTLEILLQRSAGRDEPAVRDACKAAQAVLDEVSDAVEMDVDRSMMRGLVYRPMAEEDHDGLRWKVALATERLTAALKGLTTQQAPPAMQKAEPFVLKLHAKPEETGTLAIDAIEPTVFRISESSAAVSIDGRLDEAPYRGEPLVSNFVDHQLKQPTKYRTTVHAFASAETLYLGIKCNESSMRRLKITATEENGSVWNDDCIEVFLDPGHTQRCYYHFGVNAGGTRALFWHPYASHALGVPKPVDKHWQGAVHHDKRYWSVEIAMPLAEFEIAEPCFGLSICRNNPTHGELSCWTVLPKRSFHQPDAFADVYLPSVRAALTKLWLGHVAAGENQVKLWIDGQSDASATSVSLKAPDGSNTVLRLSRKGVDGRATVYEAPYRLGKAMGTCEFTIRSGDVPLGRYERSYTAAFFTAWLKKTFHRQGPGDPLESSIKLLTPPGGSLKGFSLRARLLRDGRATREETIAPLTGHELRATFSIADLPVGVYDLELALLGPNGEVLKRAISEFEVLPRFDQ